MDCDCTFAVCPVQPVPGPEHAQRNSNEISYSDFLAKINNGEISSITASMNGDVVAKTADGKTLTTYAPVSEDFLKTIREKNVTGRIPPTAV